MSEQSMRRGVIRLNRAEDGRVCTFFLPSSPLAT